MVRPVLQFLEEWVFGAFFSLDWSNGSQVSFPVSVIDLEQLVKSGVLRSGVVHEFPQQPVLVTQKTFKHLRVPSDIVHVWRVLRLPSV